MFIIVCLSNLMPVIIVSLILAKWTIYELVVIDLFCNIKRGFMAIFASLSGAFNKRNML